LSFERTFLQGVNEKPAWSVEGETIFLYMLRWSAISYPFADDQSICLDSGVL
jgi:hypothetical protein